MIGGVWGVGTVLYLALNDCYTGIYICEKMCSYRYILRYIPVVNVPGGVSHKHRCIHMR